MSAIISDIGQATKALGVSLDTQSSATVKTRYGAGARDTGATPARAFFDSIADAAIVNAERFALMGTERAGYTVAVDGIVTVLDPSISTPTVKVTDSEHGISKNFLVSRISIDLDSETTSLEIFG